jgi:hypothetical protein
MATGIKPAGLTRRIFAKAHANALRDSSDADVIVKDAPAARAFGRTGKLDFDSQQLQRTREADGLAS